jgi:hypothetical protein
VVVKQVKRGSCPGMDSVVIREFARNALTLSRATAMKDL